MTLAPADMQMPLLEVAPSWHITKNAQARNAYGTVAQHLVCAALRLLPIPTNGNYDICFDALGSDGTYFEVKSVKAKGGKVVIYDWRMAKEASVKVRVGYAILLHAVKGSNGRSLVSEFINGGLEVLVIPAAVVHSLAKMQPLNQVKNHSNPRMGYSRKGYKDGYRNVPVTLLREMCASNFGTEAMYAGHKFTCVVRIAVLPATAVKPF